MYLGTVELFSDTIVIEVHNAPRFSPSYQLDSISGIIDEAGYPVNVSSTMLAIDAPLNLTEAVYDNVSQTVSLLFSDDVVLVDQNAPATIGLTATDQQDNSVIFSESLTGTVVADQPNKILVDLSSVAGIENLNILSLLQSMG